MNIDGFTHLDCPLSYNPLMEQPVRKNIRLATWNYSVHAYYHVTICTQGKKSILSTIDFQTHELSLTDIGECVQRGIGYACEKYPTTCIDKYVIMPNHVHLLVAFEDDSVPLGKFIGCVKSASTRFVRRKYPGFALWQRNYYDHILRG